ncbi:MAG: hypothetical protein R2849_16925 [Thermomicrobiales bacterium]
MTVNGIGALVGSRRRDVQQFQTARHSPGRPRRDLRAFAGSLRVQPVAGDRIPDTRHHRRRLGSLYGAQHVAGDGLLGAGISREGYVDQYDDLLADAALVVPTGYLVDMFGAPTVIGCAGLLLAAIVAAYGTLHPSYRKVE